MSELLKEFQEVLLETNKYPKDELTEYYLVSAMAMLSSNPMFCKDVFEDKTALMMIYEQIVKPNVHSIRNIHLNVLAMDVIMNTSPEMLNYQNKNGDSAVHISTQQECFSVGLWDCMKESGASFSLVNKNGETPLILVSKRESLDDVKCIHAYSTPRTLDHRDLITGSTALMHAVYNRRISNIFYLLDCGASLFVRNDAGKTVLDIMEDDKYKETSERQYYNELMHIVKLFKQKQIAEISLREISNGSISI